MRCGTENLAGQSNTIRRPGFKTRRNSRKMASIWSCVKRSITPTFQIPIERIVLEGQGKDVAAGPDIHDGVTAFQHRPDQIQRQQRSAASSLIDQHRRFRCSRAGLDQQTFARKVPIDEIGDSSREHGFAIEAEEPLRTAVLIGVGPVLRPVRFFLFVPGVGARPQVQNAVHDIVGSGRISGHCICRS